MNFTAAALYAMSSAVLIAIAIATFHGALNSMIAGFSLAAGTLVAGFALWETRDRSTRWSWPGPWGWIALTLFALFSLRSFLWLIFHDDGAIKVLSPNNLGDMSLHVTYIRLLASGAEFWPDNPIYAGAKLTYPLGVDLFNSLLVLLGADVLRGLIWVGLAGCVMTGIALWRWGGAFVIAGFLCNGGTFGFEIFHQWKLMDFQAELAWKSIPLALFVTQRGLLFALPAGLLLLCSWRTRFFPPGPNDGAIAFCLPLWGEVLLYAAMPVFHLHTFLFLSVLLGVWFVTQASARRSLAILVAAAFLPATALVLLVTDFFHGPSLIGWKPGWMQEKQNFLAFWVINFGAWPFLVGFLCAEIFAPRSRPSQSSRTALAFVLPALGVFLICCFVKFAPWEWDNTKLMIWSYLVILPFLCSELLRSWPLFLRAFGCFMLFFSGFVSLLGGLGQTGGTYALGSRVDVDGVSSAVRRLPTEATFAGWPTYNHPLLLNGRKMAMGYEGHVWSHGYPWQERRSKIEALLDGAPEWRQIADELGVRYLFWGTDERANLKDSTQPWKSEAALVAAGEWGEIYDLHSSIDLGPLP